MRYPILFTCLCLASCDSAFTAPDDDPELSQLAATSVVACNPLAFTIGSLPSGQTASTLALRELSGSQDVWTKYVEFGGGSEASCTFNIGSGTASALSLGVNYRGPRKSDMRWTFDAYDNVAGAWVNVGDNAFAADWTWSATSISLPAPLARFVAGGAVKIRYKGIGTADASQLDEWSLSATTESTPPTPPTTATYFVSPTGSDSNSGTQAAPWATIGKAARTAIPGSTVNVRGGTYKELVNVTVSGSAAAGYTTFQSFPGETAIIDGTDLTVGGSGKHDVVLIDNRSYLRWKGFEVRNFRTPRDGDEINGIAVYGTSHHIEILDNKIHDIETNANRGNAHGILVVGTTAAAAITDVLIHNNQLYNMRTGWSETLTINGNVTNFRITNNVVRDTNNIGIDIAGHFGACSGCGDKDQARNGVVSGNTVSNVDSACNPAYGGSFTSCGGSRGAGGIYVDGGRDILIERNMVTRANHGIEVASENPGKATSLITVRNNVIKESTNAGFVLGSDERGDATDCKFTNNTLYRNGTLKWGRDIEVKFGTRNSVVKNNVVYGTGQGYFIENRYASSGTVVNNNSYFVAAGLPIRFIWNNVAYYSWPSYRAGSGLDAASQYVDPQFVSLTTPDLHLQSTSPAIGKGDASVLATGELDYDGASRNQGGAPDQGAYER